MVFDAKFYKSYYSDLSFMNDVELLNHYKNHGRKEGRCTYSNQIFDISFYIYSRIVRFIIS